MVHAVFKHSTRLTPARQLTEKRLASGPGDTIAWPSRPLADASRARKNGQTQFARRTEVWLGRANVLVRKEVYERLKGLLALDDYDPDEGAAYVNEVMAEDDAHDPLLESYQKYGNAT